MTLREEQRFWVGALARIRGLGAEAARLERELAQLGPELREVLLSLSEYDWGKRHEVTSIRIGVLLAEQGVGSGNRRLAESLRRVDVVLDELAAQIDAEEAGGAR